MGLRIKNYGGSLKNSIFSGRFMKNQCIGGDAKEGWAWTVCRFKELLDEKEEVVFLKGGQYPNAHYETWCLVA